MHCWRFRMLLIGWDAVIEPFFWSRSRPVYGFLS